MPGKQLLQCEVLKWVQKCGPYYWSGSPGVSRKGLVNYFAKSIPRADSRPAWADAPAFNGDSWVELNIAERKYILRQEVGELLRVGRLAYNNGALVTPSILDVMASIEPDR